MLEHVVVRKMKKQGASGEAALNQNELQNLIKFGAADLFAEEKAEGGERLAGGPASQGGLGWQGTQ